MAYACGAEKVFSDNGTSVGILTTIMSTCRANEKIILPRNVHKSVINGLILRRYPDLCQTGHRYRTRIANERLLRIYEEAIKNHPDAKAVFAINPTYFGITSDLARISDFCS